MILETLSKIWENSEKPFFISENKKIFFGEIYKIKVSGLETTSPGDVVALIGDFEPNTILTLIKLLEKGCIVVPLTEETSKQHKYFFEQSKVQFVFNKNNLERTISQKQYQDKLLDDLRYRNNPGLILFTTGSTGNPKAILHDFIPFIEKYKTPRPGYKSLSFLLFDHIGGINTLFHMLYNKGCIVSIQQRTVENVIKTCEKYSIELLPTTPTFLRLLSLYPDIENILPKSIKIISYGTERFDQPTLKRLCKQFPEIDFKQTYGMSELGIFRVKTYARDSLFMKIGGEDIETKIVKNVLFIRSKKRMIGYLNAQSPFDEEGWYNTKDCVEVNEEGYIKIAGRDSEIINVGGLKFMPAEIEKIALKFSGVKHAKAYSRENPITGQHAELLIEKEASIDLDLDQLKSFIKKRVSKHMMPTKIKLIKLNISHRFKKL